MLGVLKIVLRRNNITAQDFSLGQGHIALVASLCILIAPGPVARAIRVPPLGAAVERAGRSGLARVRVHVDLQAILDGSLLGRACECFRPRGSARPAATYCICSGTSPRGTAYDFWGCSVASATADDPLICTKYAPTSKPGINTRIRAGCVRRFIVKPAQ
jgi:hypothetical protein